ncbi:hypothetical protein [Schlesneria paludicola]|uniref:hypothetical protein n=1 Tax=Schlesneria paludicola TaxID=360056 RepID=UPI00029AD219|nr:hypothetical protein [Schlesneria paludicola]
MTVSNTSLLVNKNFESNCKFDDICSNTVFADQDELEREIELRNSPGHCAFYADNYDHGNPEAEKAYRVAFERSAAETLLIFKSSSLEPFDVASEIYDLEQAAKTARAQAREKASVGSHFGIYVDGHEVEAARTRGAHHGLISGIVLFELAESIACGTSPKRELADQEFDAKQAGILTFIRQHVPAFQSWVESLRDWVNADCSQPVFKDFYLVETEQEAATSEPIQSSPTVAKTKPAFKSVFGVSLDQIWNPGGLMQEIIDFNLRTAPRRQPELALGGALTFVATITGQKVRDSSGICPNIYVVGVGASGCGKEQSRRINKQLLLSVGADEMAKDSLASSSGLHSALAQRPSLILQIDEFGRFMATLGNPGNSPHLSQIVDVLLKLYSQADSVYTAPCYSDPKKNVRILFPNCVLFATTVPGSFFSSLTREALSDGFISRVLIIEVSDNDPDSQEPEFADVPEPLREAVGWWINHVPCDEGKLPAARKLVISPEAREAYTQLDSIVRANRRIEESRGTQIWVRCVENAKKLALIQQCSRDRESAAITGESARWGCELSLMLTARIEQLANDHVADGAFDARGQKVMRFIRAAGAEGRTRSELSRHIRNSSKRELDETLAKLIEMEQLTSELYQPVRGPKSIRFMAIAE